MHRTAMTARPGGGRAGFTLVELMMSLVLFGLMGGALTVLLTRQQRFYRSAQEALDRRAELRHAGMLLPTDLRTISPAGGDVYEWRDTTIEFRQTLGSGVACRIFPAAAQSQQVALPPRTLARESGLTSWIAAPEAGDSLFIYDEGQYVGNADDEWRRYAISALTTTTAAAVCAADFMSTAADNAAEAYLLTLTIPSGATALPASIPQGAPIRIFRRARYSLFQQASDQRWYLGFSDCVRGRSPECSTPLAVAGPYRAYSTTPGTSGLTFSYRDAAGAAVVPGAGTVTQIARIDVITRTETEPTATTSAVRTRYLDSLRTSVALRNR